MTAEQPNKYRFCCIDCETEGKEAKLLGVSFYSDDIQRYVTNRFEIKQLLYYHAENGYIFLAHNAEYDVPIIFRSCKIDVTIVRYNGRFNRAEWKYHGRKPMAQIWDSLGLSGGISLEKLGKAIGLPKYETPQVLQGIEPDKYKWKCDLHERWECIECYCLRDAEIPYTFMCQFRDLLNSWGLEPRRRIAGISMDAWKLFDNPRPISIRQREIRELGRCAYHGGRVETFKLGTIAPAYSADVCSMYPSIMKNTPMPSPYHMVYLEHMKPEHINWDYEGVADVEIVIPESYIPPLPYNDNGKRVYPYGIIRGCWPLLEIRYAQSLGCTVRHVYRVAFATDSVLPFTRFIDTFWELRVFYESVGDPRTILAKLILNNLYGRIGMADSIEMVKQYAKPPQAVLGDNDGSRIYRIGQHEFMEETKEQRFRNPYANVLWAAQITAAARVKLHKLMMMQGSAMIYCDTDSIFSMLPIEGLGEGLGALRDEQVLSQIFIMQPKTYGYADLNSKWTYKAKGVPNRKAKEYIEQGIVYFDAPIKPMQQFSRKRLAGEWVECKRENHHMPHRRHPIVPVSTLGSLEWTDTKPWIVE